MEILNAILSAPDAWLTLIGAIFGGVGLKVMDSWLSRSKVREDQATQIRRELRDEVVSLRTEIQDLRKQVDTWRDKYYVEAEENAVLNARLELVNYKVHKTAEKVDEKHGGMGGVLGLPDRPAED